MGTVVRALSAGLARSNQIEQRFFFLDTISEQDKSMLYDLGILASNSDSTEVLDEWVSWSDITLVHWWNHPLLANLLMNHSMPASRIAFWCHISGGPAPNTLTEWILEFPDRFIFTTPLSKLEPAVQRLRARNRRRMTTIWSTAGSERLQGYVDTPKLPEHVCYVGSLDFTKMHRGFLHAVESLVSDGFRFSVIGPPTLDFSRQLERMPMDRQPRVLGFVSDEEKFREVASASIFFYPLARHHYATCDQALQEAMALGAIPLVLNNPMESYMVRNGQTGIVARSVISLTQEAKILANQASRLKSLSHATQTYANSEYSMAKLLRAWTKVFFEMLESPKTKRSSMAEQQGSSLAPHEVFVRSLGDNGAVFLWDTQANSEEESVAAAAQISVLASRDNWSSATKSSPSHFHHFFPEDPWLIRWSNLTRPQTSW